MTTTGGPDHFIVDPATSNGASDDPIVIDRDPERLPGDDITVEPDEPLADPRRRTRAWMVAIVAGVLLAVGIAVAVSTRNGHNTTLSTLETAQPIRPPQATPSTPKPKPKPKNVTPTTVKAPADVSSPTLAPPPPSTPANVTPPPPPPPSPPAQPTVYPTSVLQWSATPAAITIKGGAHMIFTVTVTNPTDGTVTLPHPLSCPPSSQHANGTPIGGGVCAEMTQVMQPHQTLTQQYTIYATDTADASGKPLPAGSYVAAVENLFNVKVTITKA